MKDKYLLKKSPITRFRFPAQSRLKTKTDFQAVKSGGKKLLRPAFTVFYRDNSLVYARIGIVIHKYQVKQAVARNLIRRVVRESFRHHAAEIKGLDIVIVLRASAVTLSRNSGVGGLRAMMDGFWHKLKADQ